MSTIITAIFSWVAVTPLAPAARGGQPGPTGPLPGVAAALVAPPAWPVPRPLALPAAGPDVAAPVPWATGTLAPQPGPGPSALDAPAPPPLVAPPPDPGTSSHARSATAISVATPAATRSPVGARRSQNRNSWLGLTADVRRRTLLRSASSLRGRAAARSGGGS